MMRARHLLVPASAVLCLCLALALSACRHDEESSQASAVAPTHRAKPPREAAPPPVEPRLGDDGVVRSRATPVLGAPVPIDANTVLLDESATLVVPHNRAELLAYLKKNFPKHRITETRKGESFVAEPPPDDPEGVTVYASWATDGYLMHYAPPPKQSASTNANANR